MKVRFTKDYNDGYTDFKKGWVAGFSQSKCNWLIANGFAEMVDESARALRYEIGQQIAIECVVDTEDLPAPKKTTPNPNEFWKKNK